MSKQNLDDKVLENIICKLDDFERLTRCLSSSHFDEFNYECLSSVMNCFSRIIFDIKQDVSKLI